MKYKDYYERLGVSKTATDDDIKKQYRRLARKYHPDVSKEKDAEEQFKSVKEAYEVLKDPEKRKMYDKMGHNPDGSAFNPPPDFDFNQYQQSHGSGQHYSHFDGADFGDFFENMFGARGAGYRQQRTRDIKGEDIHVNLTITLEEAYHGDQRTIELQEPQTKANGQVSYENKKLTIKIPPGVTQGQKIRLKGQGNPGIGKADHGDLYITIHIASHASYSLEGKQVGYTLPLTPWEAALGAEVACKTLGGTIKLKIAPNSETGQKLRLKGRGLPGNPSGDQMVTLKVILPKADSEKAKAIYEKMREELNFNPREQS
jgi:curved DNA-binding protein